MQLAEGVAGPLVPFIGLSSADLGESQSASIHCNGAQESEHRVAPIGEPQCSAGGMLWHPLAYKYFVWNHHGVQQGLLWGNHQSLEYEQRLEGAGVTG